MNEGKELRPTVLSLRASLSELLSLVSDIILEEDKRLDSCSCKFSVLGSMATVENLLGSSVLISGASIFFKFYK